MEISFQLKRISVKTYNQITKREKKKLNTIKNLLFSLFLFIITETRHVFTGATVITNGLLLTLRPKFWSTKSDAQNFVFGTKKKKKGA